MTRRIYSGVSYYVFERSCYIFWGELLCNKQSGKSYFGRDGFRPGYFFLIWFVNKICIIKVLVS